MTIDRSSPIPLYVQLKDALKEKVRQGILKPGVRLASERDLCDEYDISRTTVREALRELEQEGLISTVAGRGTFIASPDEEPALNVEVTIEGFSADMRRQGLAPSSVVLDLSLLAAPPRRIAEVMGLPLDSEVVRIKRLRLVNKTPLALHLVYLNHCLCPNILHHNLAEVSLFNLLRHEYNLEIAGADERAYAALANKDELNLLNLAPPAAVLRTERVTYMETGEVLEYAKATYCGDWYRLKTHIDMRC
ncbi:MAG: GntR family transcriptional regulator [Anaerolineae bacterium]|nr:GntR family transcriptional regulator [Anaerolineae bacterium]